MKKSHFFILLFFTTTFLFSQRGIKIGYIDTEYILENLPEYNEVSVRLEEKAADWKKEIEDRIMLQKATNTVTDVLSNFAKVQVIQLKGDVTPEKNVKKVLNFFDKAK